MIKRLKAALPTMVDLVSEAPESIWATKHMTVIAQGLRVGGKTSGHCWASAFCAFPVPAMGPHFSNSKDLPRQNGIVRVNLKMNNDL